MSRQSDGKLIFGSRTALALINWCRLGLTETLYLVLDYLPSGPLIMNNIYVRFLAWHHTINLKQSSEVRLSESLARAI